MELPIISSRPKKESEKTYLIPAVLLECGSFNLLADLVIGSIILDVQNDRRVDIPDIESFSSNELNVLKAAIELGQFSKQELNQKSTLDPVLTQHFFGFLLKKGFFTYNQGKYTPNQSFDMIFNPEKLAFPGKLEIAEISYDIKLEPKIQPQDLKNQLSRYVDIKNLRQCWIVFHKNEI